VRDLVEFIDRHYAKPLTVATLARRARLSPFHFIRTFHGFTGMTPHQYVRDRRLDRAKQPQDVRGAEEERRAVQGCA